MSFPKIVNQKGSFGQIRKNSLLRFCRPILDIFGFTLLICKENARLTDLPGYNEARLWMQNSEPFHSSSESVIKA